MLGIESLKKPRLNRAAIIGLSVTEIGIVGFGLNLHLLAVLLSALLFACGYLLEPDKTES